jgi:hypothetical protein
MGSNPANSRISTRVLSAHALPATAPHSENVRPLAEKQRHLFRSKSNPAGNGDCPEKYAAIAARHTRVGSD